MLTNGLAIYKYFTAIIYGLEVEQHIALERIFNLKSPAVPKRLGCNQQTLHATKLGLQTEWNQNLPIPIQRQFLLTRCGNCEIPSPVQIRPIVPCELRTRVFSPRVLGCHSRSPSCDQLGNIGLVASLRRGQIRHFG